MREHTFDHEQSFVLRYETYADMVYRIAFVMLKNKFDAQDVTQGVFTALFTAKKEFESEAHVKAWLIVTTQNNCKNIAKHWWQAKRTDSETMLEQAYSMNQRDVELWEAVAALPDKQRLPLYLHYVEGYKTEEIANMLHLKPATVRTRLWAARNKLKLSLEEEWE